MGESRAPRVIRFVSGGDGFMASSMARASDIAARLDERGAECSRAAVNSRLAGAKQLLAVVLAWAVAEGHAACPRPHSRLTPGPYRSR